MQKNVQFQLEDAIEIPSWTDAYPEHKFAVFKCCFLSTSPNSHKLNISSNTLKKNASTILGNFLVAKLEFGDATTHKVDELMFGYFPMNQEIEFVEADNVLKAYAYAVVSKRYGKEFNDIFEFVNLRNSSVEMTVETPEDDEHTVLAFDIYGLTCLGKNVKGSCPDADIQMVRFAKEEAEDYYAKNQLTALRKFVQEREHLMAKSYKVDKSKEAMSTADWGDVDKDAMRDKIMEADNQASLVKDVYALVENSWEEAPSEHLKYPLMELKGDTFVYNRGALSSALAYARQHNETAVINKVEKIYKSLDLDESDGKEEKKMSEEVSLSEEVIEVKEELAEMEEQPKEDVQLVEESESEEKEEAGEEEKGEEEKVEMSADEMVAKIAELEQQIEEKENIIMEKDKNLVEKNAELESLKKFKADVEAKEQASAVEKILAELTKFMDKNTAEEYRKEGLAVEFSQLDAWANKVKASVVDKVVKADKGDGLFQFAAPIENSQKSTSNSVWDRL